MSRRFLIAATAAPLLAPSLALAHPGQHADASPLEALRHLVNQPDHLLALGALVLIALAGGGVRLAVARSAARTRARR